MIEHMMKTPKYIRTTSGKVAEDVQKLCSAKCLVIESSLAGATMSEMAVAAHIGQRKAFFYEARGLPSRTENTTWHVNYSRSTQSS